MSTIDEKYLGDRIKALEENITDTVASGSTAVPTAGAVYSAIQSGAVRYVVPNAVQTVNDDIFCSNRPYNYEVAPNVARMSVYGKTFKLNNAYLWIKNSAFGIDETQSVGSEFYSKFILNILPLTGNNPCYLNTLNYSTVYTGYTVLEFSGSVTAGIISLMLQ